MTELTPSLAAMHLISARGGGSARFARDLAQGREHGLLHLGDELAVVEAAGTPAQFFPYQLPDSADAANWLQSILLAHGSDLLHVHFMQRLTLELLEQWHPLGRPWLLSVHDLGFLAEHAFAQDQVEPEADADWLRRWRAVMVSAAAITVPSAYLAGVFHRHFPDLPVRIVPPGIAVEELPLPADRGLRTIAVVGALGPHKGKQRLLRWLQQADAQRYRWVLIGYTDEQLHPGHIADGRLWVHGPFLPQQTTHWLQYYEVDLVLFPNRLAESFSYALSDVWAAAVPVLVPDAGALGERVRAHGGGAVLSHPDRPESVLAALHDLADGKQLSLWREQIVANRAEMVPTQSAMEMAMNQIYEQQTQAQSSSMARAAAIAHLQPYLRTQLDDVVFRAENIRLARDYAQVRDWAEKLEADVIRLQQDLVALGRVRAELDQALQLRDADIAALQARNLAVERDAAELQQRNAEVEARSAMQIRIAQAEAAELQARADHLSRQLDTQQVQTQLLIGLSTAQAGELTVMHQRISALSSELEGLRIKAARYDRVLAWLPNWSKMLARQARAWLKPAGFRRRSA
ncbi:MAG: glycosyltransferase [Xanthomonadales bacterium]|nr:glycosyltransferase [Xanthomonadales bacterium]